jgi:hypothetical protein
MSMYKRAVASPGGSWYFFLMRTLLKSASLFRVVAACSLAGAACYALGAGQDLTPKDKAAPASSLEARFAKDVKPFVERYCVSCHSGKKPEAELDLKSDLTVAGIVKNIRHWEAVLERLRSEEMPPEDAPRFPDAKERAAAIAWIRELRDREAERNAGDPGVVLARRLSNAEFDNTIRDLTGVDIRPTREFPVDPANQAGFDNSGESLAMSPALLKKYLGAARLVADHVVLKPQGFVFAPHPVVTDPDRDKYCVQRILDFYRRHQVDFADYFLAAWKHRHRDTLGRPDATIDAVAADAGLSAKYLATVWSTLNEADVAGPLAVVREMWHRLPPPQGDKDAPRADCVRLRDQVVSLRKQLKPEFKRPSVNGISNGSQTFLVWQNRFFASRRMAYLGDVRTDLKKLAGQLKDADELAKRLAVEDSDAALEKARQSLERFCRVFPDAFFVSDRSNSNVSSLEKGRPLTAGFHLMQGYFRDDEPLCEMVLDAGAKRELDELWRDLDFVALAPMRQYMDFIFFERAEPPRWMFEAEFDFARSEEKDCFAQEKIDRLQKLYLAKALKRGAKGDAVKAIEAYFVGISGELRKVERDRLAAEPSHLEALVKFAERAYRRPIAKAERDDLLAFYHKLRKKDDLSHEEAFGDTLVSVLMSPHFCYRIDLAEPGKGVQPLSDYALASRMSYFLWSSMPDTELLSRAAVGDLRKPEVLIGQTRRMLRDPKVRGLATEFAGNWLDIRRFEVHNAVDKERFPSFTPELRQAMFEEPVRYFVDVAQRNRSVLDLLYGHDTFVNRPLAKHYGMPEPKGSPAKPPSGSDWIHVEDARPFGRGGLLPMAVFLTKNAPGLRTSPVKRGYWVVRRVLGEQIPPPPPTVPELPKDEADLGELSLPQLLARHRSDKNCAACHKRFDAIGLVFEDFGPIGERRAKDLGGRPVETVAAFPDGKERSGVAGVRDYLREKRQGDFVDNLTKKLFSYALGRGLILSDTKVLNAMRSKMAADDYRFASLVEAIVESPQFLSKRGPGETKPE